MTPHRFFARSCAVITDGVRRAMTFATLDGGFTIFCMNQRTES